MKKLVLLLSVIAIVSAAVAQSGNSPRSVHPNHSPGKVIKQERVDAPDFTITDTDGNTHNLYTTLAEGKSVFLDFFYTTCGYCIQYAPIIEQVYQNHGAGQGDIVFWGLDYGDNNAQVIAYKAANNVTNPCASGTQGGGNAATALYQAGWNFIGWPTYTIICPDKSVKWDVNYPPNVTGFNTYFAQCGTTGIQDLQKPDGLKIGKMYPVPAGDKLTVEIDVDRATNLRMEIYNLLGVKVQSTDFEIGSAGTYELEMNTSELRGGNYFIKLFEGDQVRDIRKFNVMN